MIRLTYIGADGIFHELTADQLPDADAVKALGLRESIRRDVEMLGEKLANSIEAAK